MNNWEIEQFIDWENCGFQNGKSQVIIYKQLIINDLSNCDARGLYGYRFFICDQDTKAHRLNNDLEISYLLNHC
jgi:hypothetical protein